MNDSIQRDRFYFVRHGQTDWSKDDITKGPGDYPLNAAGVLEAESAAQIFITKEENYVVISSTLQRAKETANSIANKFKTTIYQISDLNERYFGDFRLLDKNTISHEAMPPDAEPETSFQRRIKEVFTKVMNSNDFKGKTKIIVSHGLVFKQLSRWLTGSEKSIGYGEIYLFNPPIVGNNWTAQKV